MKKTEVKDKIKTILPIVLAYLGGTVLIHMIQKKNIINGIEAFIISFKTNFLMHIISIIAVTAGALIGLNLRNKNDKK